MKNRGPFMFLWNGWHWRWGLSTIAFIEFRWAFDIGPLRIIRKEKDHTPYIKRV